MSASDFTARLADAAEALVGIIEELTKSVRAWKARALAAEKELNEIRAQQRAEASLGRMAENAAELGLNDPLAVKYPPDAATIEAMEKLGKRP